MWRRIETSVAASGSGVRFADRLRARRDGQPPTRPCRYRHIGTGAREVIAQASDPLAYNSRARRRKTPWTRQTDGVTRGKSVAEWRAIVERIRRREGLGYD